MKNSKSSEITENWNRGLDSLKQKYDKFSVDCGKARQETMIYYYFGLPMKLVDLKTAENESCRSISLKYRL